MSGKKNLPGLVKIDPWLEPYAVVIADRKSRYEKELAGICAQYGSLEAYATAHEELGIHFEKSSQEWVYREWAPRAEALSLTGDFCDWSRDAYSMTQLEEGIWEVRLPADVLKHGDLVKLHVVGANGAHDRIPAYIRRLVQDEETHAFSGQVWAPEEKYKWRNDLPTLDAPRIYEAHVGMATEENRVGTYREFADDVLPRISRLGYNVVQLMAIAEHPYYGSFGYHVANFFAPASRCGTPEDLKYLIDTAHGLGIAVLMDVVHSHSVKNFSEGLTAFDGEEGLYFHFHEHPQWDSRLFDYGRPEVSRFLLSNLAYWLKEFRFDGFRFDGVTSMLYHHHGNITFDHYDRYFLDGVEWDAITYLQLANQLIHEIRPESLSIAEDMSGMPGLCRTLEEGGMGFDYRLAMGIPDHWIKLLKHTPDEEWDLDEIYHTLSNRREGEKTIAYAESHDQALVGDKTLAFWLMDAAMYHHMQVGDSDPVVERGLALHKILRLFTLAVGGEGYLNFMGNEFGHPEWVDFPREGNDWSFQYARRQWSLADDEDLKYGQLERFDAAMLEMARLHSLLSSGPAKLLNVDQKNLCVQFERGGLVFAINLNPTESVSDYSFPIEGEGDYRLILSSDEKKFGGHDRTNATVTYPVVEGKLTIYSPNRTVLVFATGD
ncbi:alpha amylase C-terminal domain-containing protein [Akkermansiaceae bacterium]|nr:alpha amylase C-terminal domain-containing protein [Akkermansiaceae bacterium]MDB4734411.1 alpha amylase C-terminal domain-containing protein [Akkermansiaceae bacterium]